MARLLVLLFVSAALYGQAFLKETHMVAMRDGVHLATDIYRPNNDRQHPAILYRTPYNKDTDGLDEETIHLLNILGLHCPGLPRPFSFRGRRFRFSQRWLGQTAGRL